MYTTQNIRYNKAETLSKDEPITEDNVRKRGEWMAVRVVKYKLGIYGCPFFRKMFRDLIRDYDYFDNPGYVLTDSYDVAQEAITFLCGHMGRSMNDTVIHNGETVQITQACFRFINAYLSRLQLKANNAVEMGDLPKNFLTVAFDWDPDETADYAGVNEKISMMNLSERQAEVLDYRMHSESVRATAAALSKSRRSIRESLKYIKKKYLKVFQDRSDCIIER